ncbi:hypothetical protein UY3_04137 [Chelonia mydas]|uniref:Uncharacterized protein n=1 Tax=Chelonia mydas TaxID=8469 RepID=M7BL81_CHEMY|nr:hypothetical protein UY3_04137 [Chelonia mydas]
MLPALMAVEESLSVPYVLKTQKKTKTAVVCACAILMVFLIVESWCAPKEQPQKPDLGPVSGPGAMAIIVCACAKKCGSMYFNAFLVRNGFEYVLKCFPGLGTG